MLVEGNRFFNKNEYEQAATIYERAAQWASVELLDRDRTFIHEAFRLAINSWISACKVEDAFRILRSLPYQAVIIILKEISVKIIAEANYLISVNNLELAKNQLYSAVNRYQLEDLFDELKDLANNLVEVLIKLFKQQVNEKKSHAAKKSYEELENLWNSYNVKIVNLDSTLKDLINQFFEVNNFETATLLIDKLNSRRLKQQLAKERDEYEDKYRALKKKEVEDYINKGIHVISEFAESEQEIIIEMNSQKIAEADELTKQNNYLLAANHLKKQAEYLKSIGKDDIRDQILAKSLDILLDGLEFENFFTLFNEISSNMKKKYLTRIFPKFFQKLHEIRKSDDYERIDKIFDESNRIYRNQMLYDQSKEISLLFIKVIKSEALKILESENNLSAVNKAEILIKKVLNIASAYLEKEENIKLTFNKIYKKITEIYIEADDLHQAHVYNDKIEKPTYKLELHKKIEKLEAKKSAIRSKKAIETRRGEELKEKDSIIEKLAQEARLDKEKDMRERKGLRRGYFKDSLEFLKTQQYDKAFGIYINTMDRLNLTKKYKLAGVSLAIASLILMKQDKFDNVKKLLNETKEKLTSLGKLFSEAFAVTLIEYVNDLKIFQDEGKFKEALHLFEDLPLFEEELMLLYELRDEEYQQEIKPEKTVEMLVKQKEIKEVLSREEFGEYSKLHVEIDQRFGKIESKQGDARKDKESLLKKRKPMRKRYYSPILELLKSQKFEAAAAEYLKLAYNFVKRKDLEMSSLMVLLYGLTLLKTEEPLNSIKNSINNYLNSLGINKKLVEDTFYVMIIQFLIDIKLYKFEQFLPKIKEMLEILPLFEEEKFLIKIRD